MSASHPPPWKAIRKDREVCILDAAGTTIYECRTPSDGSLRFERTFAQSVVDAVNHPGSIYREQVRGKLRRDGLGCLTLRERAAQPELVYLLEAAVDCFEADRDPVERIELALEEAEATIRAYGDHPMSDEDDRCASDALADLIRDLRVRVGATLERRPLRG